MTNIVKVNILCLNTLLLFKMNLKLEDIKSNIKHISKIMHILSNEERLLLLCQLSNKEMSVKEIEDFLDIKQPTLSQQLTILRNAKLVQTRRSGKQIYYFMNDKKILNLMKSIHNEFCIGDKT